MNTRFARRMSTVRPSTIREILKVTEQADIISFAGGLPAPELFPVAEVLAATESVLREGGAAALQYGPSEGFAPLRETFAAESAGAESPAWPTISSLPPARSSRWIWPARFF